MVFGTKVNNIHDFYAWRQALYASVFVGCGGLYWRYEYLFDKIKWPHLLVLTLIYIYIFTKYPQNADVLISLESLNILGIIGSLLAIIILIYVSKRLPQVSLFTFIGRNTLLFYFMSGAIPITANIIVKYFFPDTSVIVFFGYYLCVLSLAISFTYLIKKLLPFVLDLRTLSKGS